MKKTKFIKFLLPIACFFGLTGCDNLNGAMLTLSGGWSFDPSNFSFRSYSQWSMATTYSVSYELNGGTYIKNAVNCYNEIKYLTDLEFPTKEGYMFGGWYMEPELTTRLEDADPNTTGDIILYAKWVELPDFTVEGYNKGTIIKSYIGTSKDVVIPEGITIIDSYVFMGRDDLTSFELPSTLEEIRSSAFKGCSIESIELPEALEILGDSAFCNCYDLKKIVLPKYVEEVGDFCFANCWALEEVTLSKRLGVISDYMFSECHSLKTVNFDTESNVWKAGDSAFKNCTHLETLVLPQKFMTCTFYTFVGCTGLKKIVLPSSMGYIGEYVFDSCTSLEKIWLPKNVLYVGSLCFNYCNKLTIYCECLESETHRFQTNWNASRPVVWGSPDIN